ncbi:hypothetical protein A1359_17650 [Methylomonas lenta]|uniref:PEP-CTERM protein-sorting domain-containing protein n=1 Tax=Methylomonas lenta TaxID=980561 RepID=A0A177MWN0_9GAMM|nr:VPLPA-CTERM sorting domain-containing protein [Methylomonas lenta]OAI10031.1 hypothetical protein A1359_17650 [Methylomonas lenta]
MSVFSKKILLAALTTALAGSAQTATASSSASAHIDWDSLTIQYFDMSFNTNAPNLLWTQEYDGVSSTAYTADPYDSQYDYQTASDFSSTLSTNTSTLYAQSSSLRDSDDLNAYAASQSNSSNLSAYNYAHAYSMNNGYFQMTGKGIALITLDWSATGTSTGNNDSDYANSEIYVSGYFADGNGNNGSANTSYFQDTVYDGPFNQSGTFSMAIFSDGIHTVTGNLYAQAYAYSQSPVSSVPVPTAVWLFGSGLVGLLGVARRKQIA